MINIEDRNGKVISVGDKVIFTYACKGKLRNGIVVRMVREDYLDYHNERKTYFAISIKDDETGKPVCLRTKYGTTEEIILSRVMSQE